MKHEPIQPGADLEPTQAGLTTPIASGGHPPVAFRDQTSVSAHAGLSAADLVRVLWRRRATVLGLALVLAALALAYCLTTKSLYSASAEILIDPRDKVIVANDVNPSALPPDGGLAQVESQARVIESSSVLDRVVASLGLDKDPEFVAPPSAFRNLISRLHPGDAGEATSGLDQERALATLEKRLSVKRADKVFVVDVTVKAQTADKAAKITNAIADAYLADQAAARAEAGEAAADALEARLEQQKNRVTQAENAVERYKAEHQMVAANGILVSDQQLSDLTTQLAAARSRTAELQARLAQIEQARKTGSVPETAEALGSTVITQLRARNAELVQKEADLRTQLGPRHPAIGSIDSQLRDVRQLIGAELERIARAARADVDRARASEADLSKRLDTRTTETLATRQASVRLRELERDLDAARTVYSNFLLRSQETREQANLNTANARIITRATPPLQRSWPPTTLLVLGAFAVGLGLGSAWAWAAEHASPSILSPGQLEEALKLPVLVVPRRARFQRGPFRRPDEGEARRLEPLLRRILASRNLRGRDRIHGVILVSGPGDSGLSRRLAADLARAADILGDRVLLIDTAVVTSAEQPSGLVDVLRGDVPLEAALVRNRQSGVVTLPVGRAQRGAADWRETKSASWLFAQVARRFDLMIVDGSTADLHARTGPLFADCADVFLVARRGGQLKRDAAEPLAGIQALGATPSAIVLAES